MQKPARKPPGNPNSLDDLFCNFTCFEKLHAELLGKALDISDFNGKEIYRINTGLSRQKTGVSIGTRSFGVNPAPGVLDKPSHTSIMMLDMEPSCGKHLFHQNWPCVKTPMDNVDISVVIPAYNEEENVVLLYEAVTPVLEGMERDFEIVFVDDGSDDNTFERLAELAAKDSRVRVIKFRKNFGQTPAMDAGFKSADGDIIIPMDADLQNDPKDIPKLVDKLEEGYDCVSGWRKDRKDTARKRIVSRGANLLRKMAFKDTIHDSGCTLKAYRKECFEDLDLFGEMHRFIPALLQWRGFRITELPVAHHSREHGKTKYNVLRVFKGLLDMITVNFWMRFSSRPMHLFGGMGIFMGLAGLIIGGYLTLTKLFFDDKLANRPLLTLGVLLIILGVQFAIFGVLADILVKIYYSRLKTKPYFIERHLNKPGDSTVRSDKPSDLASPSDQQDTEDNTE